MKSAVDIAAEVSAGRVPADAAIAEARSRIAALDAGIEAWVKLVPDARGGAAGPLAGVPVGIKDIIDVAGLPTRYGAAAFAHRTPSRDATVVSRLRAAGAAVIGKTHTTQFAYLDTAPTRNPWKRDHTPGGSSSGSAAAVASGMVPLALGTQTVGSGPRLAAYCGIVGLKASWGRVSTAGVIDLARSFDHVGVLCRSVLDAATALGVIAGPDPADPFCLDTPVEDYAAAVRSYALRRASA